MIFCSISDDDRPEMNHPMQSVGKVFSQAGPFINSRGFFRNVDGSVKLEWKIIPSGAGPYKNETNLPETPNFARS